MAFWAMVFNMSVVTDMSNPASCVGDTEQKTAFMRLPDAADGVWQHGGQALGDDQLTALRPDGDLYAQLCRQRRNPPPRRQDQFLSSNSPFGS